MRATTEPMEGNLVRLRVEIDEPEFDKALTDVARTIASQIRVPGFRPGKVPRKVLEARLGGAGALRAEALREALPDFYARAVVDTELDPIARPDIDITAGEEAGAVSFDAVVQVRPLVGIPGYEGLTVTLPGLGVKDEEVDHQIDRLRENDAELEPVKRAAKDKDLVTIDLHGTDETGAEVVGVDDYLYEVGSGTVIEELDGQLRGTKPGEILQFEAASPAAAAAAAAADDGEGEGEGGAGAATVPTISFRVLVKDVKVKKLPEVTDEWAADSSEFETVDELRQDITDRVRRVKLVQAQMALRSETIRALGALVNDEDVPEVLVDAEVNERLGDLQRRLESQNVSLAQYFSASGQTPDDLLAAVRSDAHGAVKADLALRALVEAEDIEVSDDELDAEVVTMAERLDTTAPELRRQLDTAGRTGAVRSELRKSKALQWLLDNVELFDDEGNPIDRDDLTVNAAETESGGSAESASDSEPAAVAAVKADAASHEEGSQEEEESE